ncbi:hypothetical protein [Lichenibacterium dinghuense]|uniref:hypothetical protein n=1 Tax=Lichenibacterium dinghuense TaxID=2895977 RepID=UPI001F1A6A12|nr:hypothetical protein [Lichenibacterium sp. 6Y81]
MAILRSPSARPVVDGPQHFSAPASRKMTLPARPSVDGREMMDAVFVFGGLAFFAISISYTFICERL